MSQLTRDYKGTGRQPTPSGGMKGFGPGVVVGALLAGSGAALLAAHIHRSAATSAAACISRSGTVAAQPAQGSQDSPATPLPAAAAGAAGESPAVTRTPKAQPGSHPAPHYDFYQMLPNLTVPVASGTAAARTAPPSAPPAQYLLQVGSYTSAAEARRLRDRLARLGISARIERVTQHGRTINRVRIGPVDATESAHVRAKLAPAGIRPLVMPVS